MTQEVLFALQQGSRYHGYKNRKAPPSLVYTVVKTYEFLEPLPTIARPGEKVPLTDYNKIMQRVNIKHWVEQKGVKEVWIWGYHGGVLNLWESNMAGPYGDISNSNRDPKDLPVSKQTYTVYHYNYQRGTSEAMEDHIHQIEAVLNHVDGRERTPPEKWSELLFWGKFVGSDRTHKIVHPGCGWAHYPPNAEKDYDWANKRYVNDGYRGLEAGWDRQEAKDQLRPVGGRQPQVVRVLDAEHPRCRSWLTYKGKKLTNWWVFIGDFDHAMQRGMKLVEQ